MTPAIRRLLLALALVLGICFVPSIVAAPAVSPVASIQHAQDAQWGTVCTAFSIDQDRGLFLTAAHCIDEPDFRLDGHVAWMVYFDRGLDLAVLESRGAYRPELKPCSRDAKVGDAVVALGHAYGLDAVFARAGHVAVAQTTIPFADGGPSDFLVLDTALIGGMSGGPILSSAGCVVSIIQQGNPTTGLGKTISVIMEATKQFWARP